MAIQPKSLVRRLCLAVLVGSFLLVGQARAADYVLGPPVLVSGPSPFAACPVGSAGSSSVVYPNTEVEPFERLLSAGRALMAS